MESGLDSQGDGGRIETAGGSHVLLFRYDTPQAPNKHPNSDVSRDELVGRWFTDSPKTLVNRILLHSPNGTVIVAEVPKDRLETLRATNHPIAKNMDIENDNFILPDELISEGQRIPVTVPSENPNKYLFKQVDTIRSFVDALIDRIKQPSSGTVEVK